MLAFQFIREWTGSLKTGHLNNRLLFNRSKCLHDYGSEFGEKKVSRKVVPSLGREKRGRKVFDRRMYSSLEEVSRSTVTLVAVEPWILAESKLAFDSSTKQHVVVTTRNQSSFRHAINQPCSIVFVAIHEAEIILADFSFSLQQFEKFLSLQNVV